MINSSTVTWVRDLIDRIKVTIILCKKVQFHYKKYCTEKWDEWVCILDPVLSKQGEEEIIFQEWLKVYDRSLNGEKRLKNHLKNKNRDFCE